MSPVAVAVSIGALSISLMIILAGASIRDGLSEIAKAISERKDD